MVKTTQKTASIEHLSNDKGVISALAFDQRGALKRMMAKHQTDEPTIEQIEQLKVLVSEELTQYASSILLNYLNMVYLHQKLVIKSVVYYLPMKKQDMTLTQKVDYLTV